jgi:hypothetical protein
VPWIPSMGQCMAVRMKERVNWQRRTTNLIRIKQTLSHCPPTKWTVHYSSCKYSYSFCASTDVMICLTVSLCNAKLVQVQWLKVLLLGAGRPKDRSSSLSKVKNFLHVVHTCSEAYPASYPVGTGGSFPWGKAAGAWSWPFTLPRSRKRVSINSRLHTSSWRSAIMS